MPLRGQCYCGSIVYSVDVSLDEVKNAGVLCHCRTCQIINTDRSYNIGTQTDKVKVLNGKPSKFEDKKTDNGKPITRFFCGNCSTALWSTPSSMDNTTFVKVGALDDAAEIKPGTEIYVDTGLSGLALNQDFSKLTHFEGMMAKEVST